MTDLEKSASKIHEAEIRRLTLKLDETEGQLEAKESELRSLRRSLQDANEVEKNLRNQIDAFTKQAKETYRKYESFLEDAETVACYSKRFAVTASDALEKLLEGLTAGRKTDLGGFWKQSLPAEEQDKMEKSLTRLTASNALKKKNLFKNPNSLGFTGVDAPTKLQERYDKLLEELQAKKEPTEKPSISKSQTNLTDGSLEKEKPQKPTLFQQVTEENKEEFLDHHLKAFVRSSGCLADGFKSSLIFNTLTKEAAMLVVSKTKNLLQSFSLYLRRIVSGEENPKDINFTELNDEMASQIKILTEAEKIDYEKLTEVREKHRRLQLLKAHITNLSRESEELFQKTNLKEFTLLEQNQLILALENNIRKKEKLCAEKETDLAKVKAKTAELEKSVSALLRDSIKADQQLSAMIQTNQDAKSNLELHQTSFQKKKHQLQMTENEVEGLNKQIQELVKKEEELKAQMSFEKKETPKVVNFDEESVQKSVRKRVRAELDCLLVNDEPLFKK